MERITKFMLDRQLENFCRSIGEEVGYDFNQWHIDSWMPGGTRWYRVEKVSSDNTGVSLPLGNSYHTLREMFYILYALNDFLYWKVGEECLAKYIASHQPKS